MVVRSIAVFSILVSICQTSVALPPGVGNLVWNDEFNGSLLDLTKWNHRAPGPNLQSVNTPLSVSVGNGNMTITTFTIPSLLPGILPATHFTGQISSQKLGTNLLGGFEGTYGYFETRANFHSSPGQWSAFWLQSPTIGNPIGNPGVAGVEIDIVEYRTLDPANSYIGDRVNTALIWDGYGPERKTNAELSAPVPGLSNDTWHTYGLQWSPAGYTFFVDDVPIRTLAPSPNSPLSNANQYLILSSHVQQAFAGTIPAGAGYGSIWNSATKSHFDYVRVYALDGGSSASVQVPEPTVPSLLALSSIALVASYRRRTTHY